MLRGFLCFRYDSDAIIIEANEPAGLSTYSTGGAEPLKTIGKRMAKEKGGTILVNDSPIFESLRDCKPSWEPYHSGYAGHHFLTPLIMENPFAGITIVPWDKKIESLVFAVRAEDKHTARHSQRVAEIALAVGRELSLSVNEIEFLCWGSLLHDIGKIAVDPQIKNKPGKLTPEEYRYINLHAHVGACMVKPVFGDEVARMIEHHHDHYDGNGHNQTIIGEDIPLGARIIAVADAFDAMVSDRPYRQAMTIEEAKQEIIRCAETQFDPEVVKSFVDFVRQTLPVGTGIA